MKTVWIATSNKHKIEEFANMLAGKAVVKSLLDLPEPVEIEETGTTFEENALCKARSLYNILHEPVISDDSGLEVDAMGGMPGVYSARWMGHDTSYDIKNQAILDAVKDKERTARYVCVIGYIDENGQEHTYRGTVEGEIAPRPQGENGFGYDPIFWYPPFGMTLAQADPQAKNAISHRGKALEQFMAEQGDRL